MGITAGNAPAAGAQQVADPAFMPPIDTPEYAAGERPTVLIDAAHVNFHTAEGRYLTFADLLRRRGYVVESNDEPFTVAVLDRGDILSHRERAAPPERGGFRAAAQSLGVHRRGIAAVEASLREGELLLIADHMPIAGHSEALAAAFGLRFPRRVRVRFGRPWGHRQGPGA
ncbi:MAG TPA: hypothetical protein VGA22_12765 [Gemmatimonadales bacterium]